MEDTIFTKIVKGEVPSHKVYEDAHTLAFLDIFPAAEGHTLVIPKTQVPFVWDLNDTDYTALMNTVKKVAQQLKKISGKAYVGTLVVGIDVPHAHVHVVPFDTVEDIRQVVLAAHRDGQSPNHEALAEVAKKLRF